MPRSTHEYRFEIRVAHGVGARLERLLELTGDASSYLLTVRPDGTVAVIAVPTDGDVWEPREAIRASGDPYVFYDPLDDGMEYRYLQWHGIDRPTMERLMGHPFEPDDFHGWTGDFPESWDVMF